EHDEDTMREADFIVDIGPRAGVHGGEVVATGSIQDIINEPRSITGDYLSGRCKIDVPETRAIPDGRWIKVKKARQNNLKNVDVSIPVGLTTVVTGVSGSGKSSLVNEIIYPYFASRLNGAKIRDGNSDGIDGIEHFDKVIAIDQSPIGRTPRSNPATYTGVFSPIRELFAGTIDAKERGYKAGRFSFNVSGGRCEHCEGDGAIKIEMHFLPDMYVPCEVCKGKRYNRETLQVKYKGKNISDVLEMTVDEACDFFKPITSIYNKIKTLQDVGLGYIKLGQSSTTLSGGEAQRVKLATELAKRSTGKTLYILDEPTTGLHSYDVQKLTDVLKRLQENGNTVVIIEHNLDVIKLADYIVDLGPDGGDNGGRIIATGTPEEIAKVQESYTGEFIKKILNI
ncbi:MAG: ATP-binding cassette domain-containing protein, partial [Clostridia bacterium]|nr:ATP-binding cassette domain-containing protein [Clostridia bacterium]